jgi:superfamily II DNA or RNA helicase
MPAPRQWQEAAANLWATNGHRGIAEVVTGAGKTIFAMLCMSAALDSGKIDTVVVLVPTIALLDQWAVALNDELGLRNTDIGLWSGRARPSEVRPVNVMVVNTARSVLSALPAVANTLLIVDECHRVASSVNSGAIAYPFGATLGMSATPGSDFGDALQRVLVPLLGPVIYRYALNDAYRDGILAKYDLTNVGVDLLPDEQDQYDMWTGRIARYLRKDPSGQTDAVMKILLQKRAVVSAKASIRVPVAVSIVEKHRSERVLVFHEYKKDAETIVARLHERGHSATIYHSGIAGGMRRDNLRQFRRGQFDVLVTCRALDEGINIPEVQIAVIASATASTRQRVQRLGRVLRPSPGKTHASVYTLYATEAEENRLRREASSLTSASGVTWQHVRLNRG